MSTEFARQSEALAAVLQVPLLTDGARFAVARHADGQVRVFDARDASNPLGRVQANGVGQHCRWMLTSDSLVIVRADGTFVARQRPEGLPPEGGDAYRTAFSFKAGHADVLVFSSDDVTHVLEVTANDVHARAMPLAVRCLCGLGGDGAGYTLFGQSPRTADGEPGVAVAVRIDGERYAVTPVDRVGRTSLESVVAVLPASSTTAVLVGARLPDAPQLEDFERLSTPLRSDHDVYAVFPLGAPATAEPFLTVANARFIAAGGAPGHERAYFQKHQSSAAPSPWAVLVSVDATGTAQAHELAGLSVRSTVDHVQFDPKVGWTGIASEHSDTRDNRFLVSQDGISWNTVGVEAAATRAQP